MCASACPALQVLLILTEDDCSQAIEAALAYAQAQDRPLQALQILNSGLYCYGHQDLVATRHSKQQFLLYMRDQVIQRGLADAKALADKARDMGVSLNITTAESEDAISASFAEAQKGYDVIFVPKQKSKWFPIFEKTLSDCLQRKITARVIAC
jgi:hypothetical protein